MMQNSMYSSRQLYVNHTSTGSSPHQPRVNRNCVSTVRQPCGRPRCHQPCVNCVSALRQPCVSPASTVRQRCVNGSSTVRQRCASTVHQRRVNGCQRLVNGSRCVAPERWRQRPAAATAEAHTPRTAARPWTHTARHTAYRL